MSLHLVECDSESLHRQHLCALADRKQMLSLARLAKDGKYLCSLCGRVSAEPQYTCAPMELAHIE